MSKLSTLGLPDDQDTLKIALNCILEGRLLPCYSPSLNSGTVNAFLRTWPQVRGCQRSPSNTHVFLSSPSTNQLIRHKAHTPIAPGTSPAGCPFTPDFSFSLCAFFLHVNQGLPNQHPDPLQLQPCSWAGLGVRSGRVDATLPSPLKGGSWVMI